MKTIPLTQGKIALVSDADYSGLSQFKWYAYKNSKAKRSSWYARRQVGPKGKQKTVLMHRQILGFPKSEVDHKDRDGLNNQRSNLRLASDSNQMSNRLGSNRMAKSGFRGVCAHRRRFQVSIKVKGKSFYLGTFQSPKAAAEIYDLAAKRVFGQFAVLNFPNRK